MELHWILQPHWVFLLYFVYLCQHHGALGQNLLQIRFTKAPPNITSETTAAFEFDIIDQFGGGSCSNCSMECKVDQGSFQDCSSGGDSYVNLLDGLHVFKVSVTASKKLFSFQYSWTVDTIPPTASITAGSGFTDATNVTVNILFSEPCSHPTDSTCSGILCDLQTNGPGTVVPSTLEVIQPGMEYSVMVKLSESFPSGRVVLVLAKEFCTDAAGNRFQRNENSSFVIHFDRRMIFANLSTSVPESEISINNQPRTLRATNRQDELFIFLDFSEPVINTTAEILSQFTMGIGALIPTTRKTHGNRRFSFQITNVSSLAVMTVTLQTKALLSRTGTGVSPVNPITFLFDRLRPKVKLSTTSQAKTKEHHVSILILFSKPVLLFDSSALVISGGKTSRFKEVSSTVYYLEVVFDGDVLLSVIVPQNRAYDVAGNPNYASNMLQLRHFSVPAISVALYSFTTAGILATALASGALAISSASLAAAGALGSWSTSSVVTDPSRNLLGLASHIQMFAFSEWMTVSLPVDYCETVKGLNWLIPHRKLPWEKQQTESFAVDAIPPGVLGLSQSKKSLVQHRRLFTGFRNTFPGSYTKAVQSVKCCLETESRLPSLVLLSLDEQLNKNLFEGRQNLSYQDEHTGYVSCSIVKQPYDLNLMLSISKRFKTHYSLWTMQRRKLGVNAAVFGPDLSAEEYNFYFKDKAFYSQKYLDSLNKGSNSGWKDFERNLFWLGVGGVTIILLHILLLLFLRWRTKTSLRGSLSVPRLELFVILLALPCISQASAFLIRGGTTEGIIVGVLLLAIPAASLLSVLVFILVTVVIGEYVQYQEVRPTNGSSAWYQRILAATIGRNSAGKWVRKEGLAASFLPRYGLLVEDRKGPVKLRMLNVQAEFDRNKWVESGSNGVGRMRPRVDDNADNFLATTRLENFFGVARAFYIILDIARRVTLGIVFGAYSRSDRSWTQLVIATAFTAIQLVYLMIFKPYIRRGVQLVESLSLICEVGIFSAGLGLLAHGRPYEEQKPLGIFMLTLLGISFISQLANEWYALLKQLLGLSPTQEPSFMWGLKIFLRGLLLPIIPRGKWEKLISPRPQPPLGLVPVVSFSPSPDFQKGKGSVTGSPLSATAEAATSIRDSPSILHPSAGVFLPEVESAKNLSSETAMPRSKKPTFSQQSTTKAAEGQRGKVTEPKSTELKLLQRLAKASFPAVTDADASDPSSSQEDVLPNSSLRPEIADHGKHVSISPASEQRSLNSSDETFDVIIAEGFPCRGPWTRSSDYQGAVASSSSHRRGKLTNPGPQLVPSPTYREAI
ncbi:hypothetical protein O6H91_17G061800 [Diphasiastrum complanatum]|uniref:Uncharacterized protein n=1 Tax=Diphasiastrum complanatum TaxID=34168 RepID=A0ACC2B7E3_DIPCM|nr:hypothetical protein O6H91_17G061800 [Diphasiastrum complanatum]